ncbi:BglG family transcription antiterminator LicT [Liquorilactobacillus capillatus]|uniref:Transcription antiterminator n=1 Tax=Liquorilactobacillus capillatus DSM 19910 TaxID=1423731 RepID=A0A0R1MA22_9LACO|nr:PRD domain-containing protein [Liquorilactobacillus capillatus]KRL00835.1 transcription antiterminator [Liquorilactobacillus capillatus DSM 19910]
MKVKQVFNNNVLLASQGGQEVVLVGRGIGFKQRPGMPIEREKVSQVFAPTDDKWFTLFHDLIQNIAPDYLELSAGIIKQAEEMLHTKFNDYLLISLTDHLDFAVTRYKQKIQIHNEILWEIKNYYPNEYQAAAAALKMVEQHLKIRLPEDEAGFIAIKFLESSIDHPQSSGTVKITKLIGDIVQIIQYQLQLKLDPDTMSYRRFLVHVRFLAERILQKKINKAGSDDEFLFQHVVKKYPASYECTKKVTVFISKQMQVKLSVNEQIYLTIHIQRILDDLNKKTTQKGL